MGKPRRPAARAPADEVLLCFPAEGLRADVAGLTLGVLRAFLDRDRDRLPVFLVGMILFGAACFLNLLAELVVAAFFPVLHLAGRLQRLHFFPKAKQSGAAQAAHCVRIMVLISATVSLRSVGAAPLRHV